MSDTKTVLPTDPAERKAIPLVTGVLDYFPNALAEVAKVSKAGNDQHNPGQPLHWARGKSMDHADTLARHLVDRGTIDKDGVRHSAKVVWRALAMLEEELENAGATRGRGSRDAELVAGGETIKLGDYQPLPVTSAGAPRLRMTSAGAPRLRILRAEVSNRASCPWAGCDAHWRDAEPGEVASSSRSEWI